VPNFQVPFRVQHERVAQGVEIQADLLEPQAPDIVLLRFLQIFP
jgi:hypothetical protein